MSTTTTLKASNGKFVCAENGGDAVGTVIANRETAGPWETFTLEAHGTQVALKTSGGFYWCAENGGGATLHANRTKVGPWERFTVERQPDGTVALRTSKGPYVSADLGLDGLLVADRPKIGPWERFQASYTGTGGVARKGLVRASGRHFVDDGGPFLPLGGTLFWALHGWKFEQARLKQNLEFLAKHGYDYARILAQVDWSGNAISEKWPDHVQLLGEVIDYAASLGVRTQITGIGGGTYDDNTVLNHVIAAAQPRPDRVIYTEVVNEWFANWHASEDRLKAMGKKLRAGIPNLVAVSAPKEEVATTRNKGWVADGAASMGTMHLDRSDSAADWKWRHVRKPWEARDPGFPSSHGEPGGPLSSVVSYMEPIHLVMSRATGILCGVDAYCLHNGAGVQGQVDPPHGRPANLWDVPGIDTIMQTVRALDRILPAHASDGVATRTGLGGHPLSADVFWPDGNKDHGVVRDYARRNGPNFWQVLLGVKGHVNLTADHAYTLTFTDPVTQVTDTETVTAGETITIGVRSVDSRGYGAWIVTGHQA